MGERPVCPSYPQTCPGWPWITRTRDAALCRRRGERRNGLRQVVEASPLAFPKDEGLPVCPRIAPQKRAPRLLSCTMIFSRKGFSCGLIVNPLSRSPERKEVFSCTPAQASVDLNPSGFLNCSSCPAVAVPLRRTNLTIAFSTVFNRSHCL